MNPAPRTVGSSTAVRAPLVIGYGNALRCDDGIGRLIAQLVHDDARAHGVTVVSVHQLTPEIAADVAAASLVVFVDARDDDGPAGVVEVDAIEPGAGGAVSTHHTDPRAILALARELYGATPAAFTVTVSVESTGPGLRLRPVTARAVPDAVRAVIDLVTAGCDA